MKHDVILEVFRNDIEALSRCTPQGRQSAMKVSARLVAEAFGDDLGYACEWFRSVSAELVPYEDGTGCYVVTCQSSAQSA